MDAPAARAPVSGAWQLATGNWQLVGEFTEVERGKHSDRPQLAAALAACKKHRAKLVIAKLDRHRVIWPSSPRRWTRALNSWPSITRTPTS